MKGSRPTIMIIDNSPAMTGALKSIMAVTSELVRRYKFILVSPSKSLFQHFENNGIEKLYVSFVEIQKNWKLITYLPMLVANTIRLQRVIKKDQIHVIHVNDIYNMCGVLLKIFNPKLLLIHHVRLLPSSYVAVLYKFWAKVILKFSDHIVCVSQAVYDALPPSSKKQVIYDSIPTVSNIDKQKSAKFTFLYIGNYIVGKGQHFAIEAFASKKEFLKDARLIFVGGDMGQTKNIAYKNKLKKLVEEKGLSEVIQFQDFTNDLSPVYQQAHVTLNFSESESFSMVCLESLMNGTPVIATKCGGPEELITNGENGYLVENRNINEMVSAMVTIYQENELRNTMSTSARTIEYKISLSASVRQLSKLYVNS